MVFTAYVNRNYRLLDQGQDEATGILGPFDPEKAQPVATADTLNQLELEAWAYLGHEPSATLYLTDTDHHLYHILKSEKYHTETEKYDAEMERAEKICTMVTISLLFCLTCLVAASIGSYGIWPLVLFIGALVFYGLLTSLGMRGITAILPPEMVLIFCFILIPMARHEKEHQIRERGSAVRVDSSRR